MLDFVNYLLSRKDNMREQLLLLREYQDSMEVQLYITILLEDSSPYVSNAIYRYYYGLEMKEVPRPEERINFLGDSEFVNQLLSSKENMKEQLLLLRENQNHLEVQSYMEEFLKLSHSPYCQYLIEKYYFNRPVEEVPREEYKLTGIEVFPILRIQEKFLAYSRKNLQEKNGKWKQGGKVRILSGCFNNMVGVIKKINKKKKTIQIALSLFGQETIVEEDFHNLMILPRDGEEHVS